MYRYPCFAIGKYTDGLSCAICKLVDSRAELQLQPFKLSGPYDIDEAIFHADEHFVYAFGKGRRSLMYWRFAPNFNEAKCYFSNSVDHFSTPQVEKIYDFNCDRTRSVVFLYSMQLVIYELSPAKLIVSCVIDTAGKAALDVKFHKNIPDILVLITDDRIFKIWNVSTSSLIYQSHVLTNSLPSSLDLSPSSSQLVITFSNGLIIGHGLIGTHPESYNEVPKVLFRMDLTKKTSTFLVNRSTHSLVLQHIKQPSDDIRNNREIYFSYSYPSTNNSFNEEVAIDVQVLSVFFYLSSQYEIKFDDLNINGEKHYANEIKSTAQFLFALLPRHILKINIANLEIEAIIELPEIVHSGFFGVFPDQEQPFCVYYSSGSVTLLVLNVENGRETPNSFGDHLTIIPNVPLLPGSILKKDKIEPRKPKNDKPPQLYKPISQLFRQPGSLDKKGRIVDSQPITFHNKVRSSGYAAQKPFSQKNVRSKSSGNSKFTEKITSSASSYPVSGTPPSELFAYTSLNGRKTASIWLQSSYDGKWLAFSQSDGEIGVLSTKKLENPRIFTHHRQYVRRINWSKCGSWLAACCDDGSASFWSFSTGERLFSLNEETGKPFKQSVNHVQFYYMDQFVLAAVGNKLGLYSCAFSSQKNDIKRYQVNSVVKKVTEFEDSSMKTITVLNAINSFQSYLAIYAGSDHSVKIFDFNAQKIVRNFEEVHPKGAHCIALAGEGVSNAAVPNSVYNLYATSAVGDSIRLWDIRENDPRPIRCFQGHINRSCPFVSTVFSPCARFLATGSEDRSLYLFDIRSDQPLARIEGGNLNRSSQQFVRHSETVSGLAFNVTRPQLFASTMDGNLYMYQ